MIGKSHLIFGVGAYALTGTAIAEFGNIEEQAEFIATWTLFTPLAILGSLFPDLDHHNSAIKRNFIIKLLTLPLTWFGHRTWSHSLFIMLLLSSFYLFLPGEYVFGMHAFLIGYASHVLGDWMTTSGVPLLYPMKRKFRSPFFFKTGSKAEYPVALLPLLIAFLFFGLVDKIVLGTDLLPVVGAQVLSVGK